RAYNRNGSLAPRTQRGALITDPERAAAQAVKIAAEGRVVSFDGAGVNLAVQTICCHGDTPGAPQIVRAVREALEKAGVQVRPLSSWLP
ncbi:MAG TPA: LamB/YcsF family protein, partial [Methylomirabilota bacterium]|nr:LamB/YcsF family protein [Methylomirabilota bacterium]